MSRLSRSNGFKHPEYPKHLPSLDVITERLVSHRILFMQIRRLRHVYGAKGISGQVISGPVDVNEMVTQLPPQLNDDHAFNVHIKRHQIHKSSYLEGWVNKAVVKAWLKYLMQKPLYRNVTMDEPFFQPKEVPMLPVDGDVDPDKPPDRISQTAQTMCTVCCWRNSIR